MEKNTFWGHLLVKNVHLTSCTKKLSVEHTLINFFWGGLDPIFPKIDHYRPKKLKKYFWGQKYVQKSVFFRSLTVPKTKKSKIMLQSYTRLCFKVARTCQCFNQPHYDCLKKSFNYRKYSVTAFTHTHVHTHAHW